MMSLRFLSFVWRVMASSTFFAEIGIGRDEEDSRAAVVFCLREEVGGNPFRIRAAVSDAADFRGACNHVDADGAKDEALGHSDEGICPGLQS
jgi:hypothetical protein